MRNKNTMDSLGYVGKTETKDWKRLIKTLIGEREWRMFLIKHKYQTVLVEFYDKAIQEVD